MSSSLFIAIFIVTIASFVFVLIFWFYIITNRNKQKNRPIKGTIFAKVDLINRLFLIEKLETRNRLFFKNIHLNKWNKISKLLERYNPHVSKKIIEVFDKLEKGSLKEQVSFLAPSFHTKNRQVQYNLSFDKIVDSTYYIVCFRYNHILLNKKVLQQYQIKEISKTKVAKDQRLIKGFVAFNVRVNIENATARFKELINFKRKTNYVGYLKHNSILIIVIFANKNCQIKNMINKIKKNVENDNFSNELKHLYEGSAIAISKQIDSIKKINQVFQALSFLCIHSMKTNEEFLHASSDIDKELFKTYNQALTVFDQALKTTKFEIKSSSIRNMEDNKAILSYNIPHIKNINKKLFNWITSDFNNKYKLTNAFAEKVLFNIKEKKIVIDVNDNWLSKNIERIINKKVVIVINFSNINKQKSKIDLIKKVKDHNIPFALRVNEYNDTVASILKITNPQIVFVGDNIWTESKLLASDYFMNLISLNALAKENKIRIIYKNPSLVLDKKIYSEIGLKYYFQT